MTSWRLARDWNCHTRVGMPLTRMFCAIHCTFALGGAGISGHASAARRPAVPDNTISAVPNETSSAARLASLRTVALKRCWRESEFSFAVEVMAAYSSEAEVVEG